MDRPSSSSRHHGHDLHHPQHQHPRLDHHDPYQTHAPAHRSVKSAASSASLRTRVGSIHTAAPSVISMPGTPLREMYNPPRDPREEPDNGNVRVVVRVRGFLPREIEKGARNIITMNPDTQETTLHPPKHGNGSKKAYEKKSFTFDRSFWSCDPRDPHYASQEDVYDSLGSEFLDHNFDGYHTCIFAYGQTGSGKSYTMMGTPHQMGLIPKTCKDLFERIERNKDPNVTFYVRVSYFEVYNEHVRDLLVPRRGEVYYLKVRESPSEGPYVKDLTEVPVRDIKEVIRLMRLGDKNRTVASTNMNDTSSRSHAVFTLVLKQIYHDMSTDETTERLARIRLVDLAGSERANSTGATGARLREGSNINKSLTTLGRVIAALADNSSGSRQSRKRELIPYRDSILTWLLKDSLGGNSKTAMIACISPTDYEETLSTLRYADQAKRIRTKATVNQDHISAAERDAQIKEMQETIRQLQISVSQANTAKQNSALQQEQLEMYQHEVQIMQRKMEEAKQIAEGKIKALQTQNEALRLHLKLVLETIKNPIPDVAPVYRKENESWTEQVDSDYVTDESEGEEEDDYEEEEIRNALLRDLGVFKRKLVDDRQRFVAGDAVKAE